MDIKLLYFDGSPSWQSALANLKTALSRENLHVNIELVKINNLDEAIQNQFLGSPSIHIGDSDLWPEPQGNYFMGCRVYPTSEGLKGIPTVEMFQEKLAGYKFAESGMV